MFQGPDDTEIYKPQQNSHKRRFQRYGIPIIVVLICILYFVADYTLPRLVLRIQEQNQLGQQQHKEISAQSQNVTGYGHQTSNALPTATSHHADPVPPEDAHATPNPTYIEVVQHAIAHGKLWEAPSAILSHHGQNHRIVSPNEQHRLMLERNGNLRLQRKDIRGFWESTWTAMTGSERHTAQAGTNFVTADPNGVLRVQVVTEGQKHKKSSAIVTTVWHSDMLAQCKNGDIADTAYSNGTTWPSGLTAEPEAGLVRLHNNGRLEVLSRQTGVSCVIHPGDASSLDETEQWGRLAVIVTGLYRTLDKTCQSHMDKIITPWNGTGVDVFIYTYHTTDNAAERQAQLDKLRACYGSHLKNVTFDELTSVEEPMLGDFQESEHCRFDHATRLHNQLKTLAMAHNTFQRYQIRTGTTYNAVMRLRPDTELSAHSSAEIPQLPKPSSLGPNKLIIPHPRGEHYFYCPSYSGEWKPGTSDQIIYGSVAAAANWFNLYYRFDAIMELNAEAEKPYESFRTCAEIPAGGERPACHQRQGCAIECVVSWYLSLVGVEFEIDWTWPMNLRR